MADLRTDMEKRMDELAEMLERDASETLSSEGATYWHKGKQYAVRDKVDWALGQLERAAHLRRSALRA